MTLYDIYHMQIMAGDVIRTILGIDYCAPRRRTPSSASFAAITLPCVAGLTCLSIWRIRPSSPMKNVQREAKG